MSDQPQVFNEGSLETPDVLQTPEGPIPKEEPTIEEEIVQTNGYPQKEQKKARTNKGNKNPAETILEANNIVVKRRLMPTTNQYAKWLEIKREGKGPVRIGIGKLKAVIENIDGVKGVLVDLAMFNGKDIEGKG